MAPVPFSHFPEQSIGNVRVNARSCDVSFRRLQGTRTLGWLILSALLCGLPARALSQQSPSVAGAQSSLPDAPGEEAPLGQQTIPQIPDQQLSGTISGTVIDPNGEAAVARVKLEREDHSAEQESLVSADGRFSFANVAPGPFQLTITSAGFATQVRSGVLHPEEVYEAPEIELAVATATTEVRVVVTRTELAEEQIKVEEKQRVLGFIPNFYISYIHNALPLTPRQKFELAWKTTLDPVNFALTGAVAGVQQAQNDFSGYGQGAQGYAKRYGASYANFFTGTMIGSAILPSLLKQDPRYFYKGSGGTRSRLLYAVANSVICKGDNGHWQANYSSILGGLASGGISNLYYPASDRNGVGLTFENALIGIGEDAVANIFQEFIVRRFTPNLPPLEPARSQAKSGSL